MQQKHLQLETGPYLLPGTSCHGVAHGRRAAVSCESQHINIEHDSFFEMTGQASILERRNLLGNPKRGPKP